jgi:2,3,4,5-tetrahydropyridine-2,6-dicarboxylate N-succinyltransferase
MEQEFLALQQNADASREEKRAFFFKFRDALEKGEIRAAQKDENGNWKANAWVKQGILMGFGLGDIIDLSGDEFAFFDKETYPAQRFGLDRKIRIVPGGSSVRSGAYLAEGVVCMPPMYINVGAYVDGGTMVDSHALVGSCAQIGKHVHLSAAAQIGGVLEPVGALPVIIEDNVFIGGNCGVYEGCVIRKGAVLGSGVILTGSSKVYDAVNEVIITKNESGQLEIPENAVVVAGSRPLTSDFGKSNGLSVYTPIIIKYKDEKTSAAVALEDGLR